MHPLQLPGYLVGYNDGMAREQFFERVIPGAEPVRLAASINFDGAKFGASDDGVSPWTVTISDGSRDIGRLVGFEGSGATIIGMHGLKPDAAAVRACELTVYRMGELLVESKLDAAVFAALERWLLKRGWRGNIVKKLKHTSEAMVQPVRRFWLDLGFELIPFQEGKWDEHVVKRWR